MAQRRQEERLRKAALHRLDNEEVDEEEEEEDMTDDSEAEVCLSVCLIYLSSLTSTQNINKSVLASSIFLTYALRARPSDRNLLYLRRG